MCWSQDGVRDLVYTDFGRLGHASLEGGLSSCVTLWEQEGKVEELYRRLSSKWSVPAARQRDLSLCSYSVRDQL